MGLFDGIGDAEIFERGRYMPPGFRGVVEVKKTIAKQTRKSGLGFIVELRVAEVERAGQEGHELSPVTVGEKRTWFQKMTDLNVAFPAIKAWAAAIAGYEMHEKEAIDAEVAPELEGAMNRATENPSDNDFVGCLVKLETEATKTGKGLDFTHHNWAPYEEREDEPTDAVDEMSASA